MTAMSDNHSSNGDGRNNLTSHLPDGGSASTICIPEPMGSTDFILVNEDKRRRGAKLKESASKISLIAKEKIQKSCTRKLLFKRLPILRWLPKYNFADAVGDLVAGITVGLTVIPQALAYANIAGLPPQYGLYGSFFGALLYIIFGSCKDVPMGPTAIISLLTYQAVGDKGAEHAIMLTFLSGCVILLMGILGLGFVIDFVSGPVSSGFTSAVALIIVTSQIKDLLGIGKYVKGNTFVEMWTAIIENFEHVRLADTLLGIICIVALLALRAVGTIQIGPKDDEKKTMGQKVFNKFLWLVSTTRNATLVIITGIIGWAIQDDLFVLIGVVPAGLPTIQPPPFTGYTDEDGTFFSFSDIVSNLGTGIIVLPILAILENISICKAFSAGKSVDATQEMIAIGVCNIGNSFVQAFPGTGALARSAVNNASGVRSPLGGLYTGLLVILSLLFFTPFFQYIPKTALAALIIAAVIFMVEVRVIKPMFRSKKLDLIPGLGTFIFCLGIKLEIGIIVGVGINILFILYQAARPKISMERLFTRDGAEYIMLTPDRCLIFPSVDYVRNLVTKHGTRQGMIPVVIDCSHIYGADFTAARVVESLTNDFAARNQPLFFYNLKPSVVAIFEGLQPKDFVIFYEEDDLDMLLKRRQETA
ncbi:sodium-independent sulfate anion transporter [Neocloeon triangulifer]|uniref:sodium-independent sulfate anion transporter n=1 Tax=Neocloeon triangulifer TaxID=2078957 RepID=UPI00286F44B3|nr:sodium-independent sulfate anion transporter [Neocloeon triangulifer]XP_059472339.1 sodium-independent sulfate anion transporter [Neocloeon triangulifer]XP_059472340.1 sodium-independent sulfate anion transporter [Neocloeon triangulifer]